MAPVGGQLQLLDLPPDLLIAIFQRLPFTERLRLSAVCRRLRRLCAGPSPLWRRVEVLRQLRPQDVAGKTRDQIVADVLHMGIMLDRCAGAASSCSTSTTRVAVTV